MKRFTPPILDVYTDRQLAVELDIPHHKILSLCKTGSIKAEYKETRQQLGGGFVRWGEPKPSTSRVISSWYEIQKDEALRFEAELFKTEEAEKQTITKESDNQNALNSLLKIIAVMAVDGYGYDVNQERSPIPKQLSEVAEGLGVSVSDRTVRKHLKEAVLSYIKQSD
ncbi:MAG: hypothetical protein LWW87_08525 [Geobacteraceae bacterium]|nr:hypothetical protein [Geobacteraceae bacterium]